MSWRSRGYMALILLGGISLGIELATHWEFENPERLSVLAILTVLTSFWRFQLPGTSGMLSASFLFVIISAVQLGVIETLAIGACAGLGQVFGTYKSSGLDRLIEALFRLSSAMIAAHVTGRIFHEVLPQISFVHFPLRLALTGGLYFLSATLPLAILEACTSGSRIAKAWRACSFWTLPYYVIGTGVAGFLWALNSYDDFQAALLTVPAVFLMFRWFEHYAGRLEEEKRDANRERLAAEENAALHLRTIHVLARAIDAKEQTTEDQLRRIQIYCGGVAQALGLGETDRMALTAASLLHDVGNLAVPEHITSKPGRLTTDEFERIKVHAVVGAEMLEGVRFPYPVAPIVRYHHERWDGTGYPDGLAGNAIPMGARILGAVDVFVALTSDRSYRPALSIRQALAYLRDEAGGSFDPRIVEIILNKWESFEVIAKGEARTEPGTPAPAFINTIAAAKEEEHFLNTMSARLMNCTDVPSFFTSLSEKLRGAIPFDGFAFFRRSGDTLVPIAAGGVESSTFQRVRIPLGTGVSGLAAATACVKFDIDPVEELGALTTLRSAIAAPVVGPDGCIGVLTLYSRSHGRYGRDDGRVLTAVTGKLAHLLENIVRVRAAEGAATTDELTALPNARGLSSELRKACDQATRTAQPLHVVVMDLDGFKKLNDTHGHLAGNRALQAIAKGAKAVLGNEGFIARMGGDEFVALFPGQTRDCVIDTASRLQKMVEDAGIELVGTPMLSTSWGLASFGADGNLPEALISAADKRMYEYKRTKEERTAARLARLAAHIGQAASSAKATPAS